MDRIFRVVDFPVIKIITGMRRTGKSTLLKLLMEHIRSDKRVDGERLVYINMELFEFSYLKNAKDLHQEISEKYKIVKEKLYIFLDEVQEIEEWEKAVISLFSEGIADIYITGSNAHLLSSELATLLSGRYMEFPVYSLSFVEYANFRSSQKDQELFKEFLRYGGLPGIHHGQISEEVVYQYVASIFDSILLKDVVKRNNLRNIALLEKIIYFIAHNIGSIFSAANIVKFLKKEQRTLGVETIYNYIRHLQSAFIIFKVPRFDLKGKKILEVSEKYFLGDIAIRHTLLGYRADDINSLLENIIFLELKKRAYTVYIGKLGEKEIDFIIEKNSKKAYIQVCYLLASKETVKREFSVLQEIKDNYPKYVISMDEVWGDDFEGIKRLNLIDFLTDDDKELI